MRIVRGVEGQVEMGSELTIRFDYGLTVPWVARGPHHELLATAGPLKLVLRTGAHTVGRNMRTLSHFKVAAGEQVAFVMQCVASVAEIPKPCDAEAALERTRDFWTRWAANGRSDTPWPDAVQRSLLTLKALTFARTGGIVAAPTTSLPEKIGGVRNWDYRYLLAARFQPDFAGADDAPATGTKRWRGATGWCAPSPARRSRRRSCTASRRALPRRARAIVAAGLRELQAGAHRQRRLESVSARRLRRSDRRALSQRLASAAGRGELPPQDAADPAVGLAAVEHVEKVWREPDEGIWEVRGPPRHFVHSKLMAWVAFDRAVKGLSRFGDRFPVERWSRLRDEVHADICARGFDAKVGAFMQYYGADVLDASVSAGADRRLPARRRPAHPRHRPRHRATAAQAGLRAALRAARRRDRRPAAGRGRVSRLQLLVCRRARAAGAA